MSRVIATVLFLFLFAAEYSLAEVWTSVDSERLSETINSNDHQHVDSPQGSGRLRAVFC